MVWVLLGCVTRGAPEAPAPGVEVHVTVDDLPWQIERGQQVELPWSAVAEWNRRLRGHLATRGVQASVFFTCERLDPEATELDLWSAAGHALGNHTAHHLAARKVGAAAFLADAAACQERLGAEGHPARWFRYPYLGYGADSADQGQIREGLAQLGLTNVPVAAPTAEWVFAYRYRLALEAGDEATQRAVGDAYVAHMEAALAEADRQIRLLEGRSAPVTVLLHANELNGDHLGAVLSRWEGLGARFVSIDRVMSDPLYTRLPRSTSAFAVPWALRAHGLEPTGDLAWFSDEEGRVRQTWPLPPPPWPTGMAPR